MIFISIECYSKVKVNCILSCSYTNIYERKEGMNESFFPFSFLANGYSITCRFPLSIFLRFQLIEFFFLSYFTDRGKENEDQWATIFRSPFFFPLYVNNRKRLLYSNPTVKQAVNQLEEKKIRFGAYLSKFESINVFGDEDNCLNVRRIWCWAIFNGSLSGKRKFTFFNLLTFE